MFTSCFRPRLKNVACLSSVLSVGRTAARAKCKSGWRDLAQVLLHVIYLVVDQSESLWSDVTGRTSIFRQLLWTDGFPVISRGQCPFNLYLIDLKKFHIVSLKRLWQNHKLKGATPGTLWLREKRGNKARQQSAAIASWRQLCWWVFWVFFIYASIFRHKYR